MKRIALGLLAVTLAFASACRQEGEGNGNRSGNINANVNTGNGNREGITVGVDKSVTITIAEDTAHAGQCLITVSPDSVNLSKSGKDKIKWCVINNCASGSGATVIVSNFVDQKDPAKKDPFGNGDPFDNTFRIDPANYDCKIKTKDAMSGVVGTAYKYMVTVEVGGAERGKLDPQVVIDN